MPVQMAIRLVLTVGLLALVGYSALELPNFHENARTFPMFVTVAGAVLTVYILARDVITLVRAERTPVFTARGSNESTEDSDDEEPDVQRAMSGAYLVENGQWLAWLLTPAIVIAIAGTYAGAACFLVAFLRFAARTTWRFIVIAVLATLLVLYALAAGLGLSLPEGVLMPW